MSKTAKKTLKVTDHDLTDVVQDPTEEQIAEFEANQEKLAADVSKAECESEVNTQEIEEAGRVAAELPKIDRIPKTRKLSAHIPKDRGRPKENTEPFVRPDYFGKKPLPSKLGIRTTAERREGAPAGLGSIDGKRAKF